MRSLLDVDLLAGLGALVWAVLALYLPALGSLVSYEAAAAVALLAGGRWYTRGKALAG